MAGIGWRLERLIDRGSLTGVAGAYATGAAVMALPWLLTTAVLMMLPLVIDRAHTDFATADAAVQVAYAVALLVGAPLQVVASRHSADRVYERRIHALAAPFRRALALALVVCASCAAIALAALGVPATIVWCGASLAAGVGAAWTALAVGNGLCSPTLVLGAVVFGAITSFALAALGMVEIGVTGYLLGLTFGQCVMLIVLLAGLWHALPAWVDETERLLPAFRDYAALAGAGLAFNAALWIDKLIVQLVADRETAGYHSSGSMLAWTATVPCLAWIFVEIETTFHRHVRAFYLDLERGASLTELERDARALAGDVARLLRGALIVQAGTLVFVQLAAPRIASVFGFPHAATLPFQLLLIASCFQAVAMAGLIALYYFDLRRDALRAALCVLAAVAVLTLAAHGLGLVPAAGTAVGCALGAIATARLAWRGARGVLEDTLLIQPFAVERAPGLRRRRTGRRLFARLARTPRHMLGARRGVGTRSHH